MPTADHRFSRLAALRPSRPSTITFHDCCENRAQEDTLARLLGAGVSSNRYGEHLAVRNWFSTPEFAAPRPSCLKLLSQNRDEKVSRRTRAALENPEKWLFLDTETTGLAGGTGTYAFLIGLAWWDAGGLQVEQLFMRDFAEEHSVLCQLAARLAERPVLVTFNGKTFDWPLLENRFTDDALDRGAQSGGPSGFAASRSGFVEISAGLGAFDRTGAASARIQRCWAGTGMTTCHRRFIPQFYFDYLRGGPPEPLTGIARHNQMDLRGLAALFGKINSLLAEEAAVDEEIHGLDLFGLSKYLHRKGDPGRAQQACAQAVDAGLPMEFHARAQHDLALMARRKGEHQRAAELWHEIAADALDGAHACEQLAIHYEKRVKDYQKALEFAHRAQKLWRSQAAQANLYSRGPWERREIACTKRIGRLEARLRKSTGGLLELAAAGAAAGND